MSAVRTRPCLVVSRAIGSAGAERKLVEARESYAVRPHELCSFARRIRVRRAQRRLGVIGRSTTQDAERSPAARRWLGFCLPGESLCANVSEHSPLYSTRCCDESPPENCRNLWFGHCRCWQSRSRPESRHSRSVHWVYERRLRQQRFGLQVQQSSDGTYLYVQVHSPSEQDLRVSCGRMILFRSAASFIGGSLLLLSASADGQGVPRETSEARARWRSIDLRGAPVFSFGARAEDSTVQLHRVVGAVRMRDGGFMIADAGNHRLVQLDASGSMLRIVGGVGDGPGEYRMMRAIGRCEGGQLFVHDGSHLNLTLYSDSGKLTGQYVSLPAEHHFDPVMWCGREGALLILSNQLRAPVQRGSFVTLATHVVSARGSATDSIVASGDHEYYVAASVPALVTVPFGSATLASGSQGGSAVCSTTSGMCALFDARGTLATRIVVPLARERSTVAHWRRAKSLHAGLEPNDQYRRLMDRALAEIAPRALLPRFDRIVVDDSGRLWLRTLRNYLASEATWVLVDREGRIGAEMIIDRSKEVLSLGDDYALVLNRDEDGLESVQFYRFSARTCQECLK